MTTLIFPAVNQAAVEYIEAAEERGEDIICASSDNRLNTWRLSAIHNKEFANDFIVFREQYDITHIFCPVASVHSFMQKFIADYGLDIQLIGKSPIQQELDRHKALMKRAALLAPTAKLPVIEVASILRQAFNIYGESNDEKLAAMMGIFADMPNGDVVEIGCLAGRSAFVLMWLAGRYSIGAQLTVDPWSAAEGAQKDSPPLLTEMSNAWDWDALAEIFYVNTFCFMRHAHLRLASEDAYDRYLTSPMLSHIQFAKSIAVIHIDGNHDYASVKQDCDLWLTRMAPGGWLILDDYVWVHGDGPCRAGDELLLEKADSIAQHFECGKALFVQFK